MASTITKVLEASDRFQPFWFESNARFGLVSSRQELREFAEGWMRVSGQRSLEDFLGALEAPQHRPRPGAVPKYGFRSECTGPKRLWEYLVDDLGIAIEEIWPTGAP